MKFHGLTALELRVLRLLHKANPQIAEELGIKTRTVEGTVNKIKEKLHAETRVETALIAVAHGLIKVDTI